MTTCVLLTFLACSASAASTLTGQILDMAGEPIPQARVFIEQGLDGAIRESRSDRQGLYRFEDVEPGTVGVFAIADDYAFGGLSITVPGDERVEELTIRLRPPTSLSGQVLNEDDDPVAGARVIRIGLMNEPQAANPNATTKLGIPYAKLEPMGFKAITSDSKGRFTVPALPQDGAVALKIACHGYAQQGVTNLQAGDSKVKIILQRGILIQGRVLTRSSKAPLSGAVITLRNALPPHDTAVTRSDGAGEFAIRLQPGVYLYKASGGDYRGVGWQELLVTGQQPSQSVVIYAVGSSELRGKVANAVTGEPIAGARVVLRAFGNPDSSARTNTDGEYVLQGVEGENTVILESAPGYILPERNARPVNAAENERVDLPTFWMMPTPEIELSVVDQELNPVPRCVVSLIQPPQFGWQAADESGRVALRMGQLASEGVVLGTVEHLDSNMGAVFAFNARDTKEPVVQLLPLATISGRIEDGKGKPVAGVMVGLILAEDQMESPMWRTVSASDGTFAISGIVPHVQLQCIAYMTQGNAESELFVAEPSASKRIETLVVSEPEAGKPVTGQRLQLKKFRRVAGPGIEAEDRPTVLAFCSREQASIAIEGWERIASLFAEPGIQFAVVVDAPVALGEEPEIAVLQGEKPGTASTYLVSGEGDVVFETFGIPPVSAMRQLRSAP